MFTGIVQGIGRIYSIDDHDGLRTLAIDFPEGFCDGVSIGASVAVDGVCLTVTGILSPSRLSFDIIQQTLTVTTLGLFGVGQAVNVERSAKGGAEIGGHIVSGHIDFRANVDSVSIMDGNKVVRFTVPPAFMPYIFTKGFIAVNGCSLTVSDSDRAANWFEVWLIPETRRVTTFEEKKAGDQVNVEIERQTQIIVDTVRATVHEMMAKS